MTKTRQSEEPGGGRTHTSTAHWCTLGAALDELGWPWLRLHGELVAGRLSYRTYPSGHTIDWCRSDVQLSLDLEAGTVTITQGVLAAEGEACFVLGLDCPTVAVEVLLPVGQRPPVALIKASWRDRVDEKAVESFVKEIAQSYDDKPPPTENDIWSAFKARWPDCPRWVARDAIETYAAHLKRTPGQRKKIKSPS